MGEGKPVSLHSLHLQSPIPTQNRKGSRKTEKRVFASAICREEAMTHGYILGIIGNASK